MTSSDELRRNSVLATVSYHGQTTARELRNELESVHGVAVTLDRVRADLRYLADLSAVRYDASTGITQITVEGREHAQQLRKLF